MPVQPTVYPAQRASGTVSALSDARLLSALATLRDALAPDVALNLPAVLDEAALLACLSAITANTPTPVPAPDTRRPATVPAPVVSLPHASAATPAPIDLDALTERELEVIFFSSRMPYNSRQRPSYAELADVVVDQINRVGLHVIKEIARQVQEAIDNCQWQRVEGLIPGSQARDDARWLTHHFTLGRARASRSSFGAVAAWHHTVTARPASEAVA
ncbi:hypothetical protein ABZ793_30695 [Micromonospora sp. NPDC047465]|uniref:hypothetical protein n=1 Tax=Micromonospora sp. NPDC047465 TaxID=3154813 RepID=UPI0033C44740